MKKQNHPLCFLLLTSLLVCTAYHEVSGIQYVIYKFDDLSPWTRHDFQRAADTIAAIGGKCSMGIYALDAVESGNDGEFMSHLQDLCDNPEIEIWFHAFNRVSDNGEPGKEFYGTPYDYQKDHIDRGIEAMLSKCGYLMRIISLHWHGEDETTHQIVNENPYLVSYMYAKDLGVLEPAKDLISDNFINEAGTGMPNFENFRSRHQAYLDAPYLIVQLHPQMFTDKSSQTDNQGQILDRWAEFGKIVHYLESLDIETITPYEYCCMVGPWQWHSQSEGIPDATFTHNPSVRPKNADSDFEISAPSGSVGFRGLPTGASLKLYSLSGQLINCGHPGGTNWIPAHSIQPGTYTFAIIQNSGAIMESGKLRIVR